MYLHSLLCPHQKKKNTMDYTQYEMFSSGPYSIWKWNLQKKKTITIVIDAAPQPVHKSQSHILRKTIFPVHLVCFLESIDLFKIPLNWIPWHVQHSSFSFSFKCVCVFFYHLLYSIFLFFFLIAYLSKL